MSVENWSTSASLNTSVGGKNIAENSPRDELNDAIRAVMAEAKERFLDQNIWAKDYGCVFDNTTDDTTELAAAITDSPQDWHMLQRVFEDDLDLERIGSGHR